MPWASSRSSAVACSAWSSASVSRPGSSSSSFCKARRASFRVMVVCTSRCCAPSCRSRTTRRRSSSVAATIRARDAATSARASVFAIAVATSSVNSASRSSMWSGRGSASATPAPITPQNSPSTTIAAPVPSGSRSGLWRRGSRRRFRRSPRSSKAGHLREQCGGRALLYRPGGVRLERMRSIAPRTDHGGGVLGFVAPDHHQRHAQHLSDFPRDGGEHLRRRRPARDQRRDPPQRCL